MVDSTRYYWKVVAISAGGQTASSVWFFATHITGDINGDGHVNVGDLQLLVSNWGKSVN